jgi:hypothetical protein
MREFYRRDFDMAGGGGGLIVPDAEVVRIIVEAYGALGWHGTYTTKCNHREILDGIFEMCGVLAETIRTISSAVDKLDKMPWRMVRRGLVEEKGLKANVADRIEGYVTRKGGRRILDNLSKDGELMANANARAGMEEMGLLIDYMTPFGVLDDRISFDMSLARGVGLLYRRHLRALRPSRKVQRRSLQTVAEARLPRTCIGRPRRRRWPTQMKTDQMTPPSERAVWRLADDTTISLRDSCLKHKCLGSAFRLGWSESFQLQKHEWSVRSSSKPCERARRMST